jgi:CheY-like chemotaxis protein
MLDVAQRPTKWGEALTGMASLHILSVGYDRTLMFLRSEVLRRGAYEVEEAYSIDDALSRILADNIDLLLIRHTVSKDDQEKLVAAVRSMRSSLAILCVSIQELASAISGCDPVRNTPMELLEGVRSASLLCVKHRPRVQPG